MTTTNDNAFTFTFRGLQLRAFDIEGSAWFIAKDVCDMLDLADVTSALRSMPGDEKSASNAAFPGMRGSRPRIINRAGFFRLVMRSRKAEAVEIQNWVTSEVLPQIEEVGGYIPVAEGDDEQTVLAKALLIAQRTIEKKDVVIDRFHDRITVREFLAQMTRENGVYFLGKHFAKAVGTR
ncbi:BRO-N domain-containing protein [Acuticoccus mangrovi]|uniref:Bro-N domain-containing protein n=1 Tax=Acuticoccus mangrovi TaxID=2796142 RepID=A0A934MIF1_9HYPH|nr:Bro-N domain-containing protein [Acuticoccus mangrovi]MBJ3777131.1 Bro-N domain-containing protein [Acuticoccus mangrovi]